MIGKYNIETIVVKRIDETPLYDLSHRLGKAIYHRDSTSPNLTKAQLT